VDVLEKLKPGPKPRAVPKNIDERCNRGRKRMLDGSAARNKYLELWRGNHYAWVDEKNVLQQMATITSVRGTGKPPWLERRTVNLIFDAVEHEVSSATSRVPSYDVAPSTVDQEDKSAAEMAKKVALYGHDKWNFRQLAVGAVRLAVVAEEAFAWPHWDSQVGPFINGENIGVGEIRVKLFSGNQTYWEPGVKFDDSRWHCVEYAKPADEIKDMDGYLGGELTPDADALSENKGQDKATNVRSVLVTEYLERPCPEYPDGRWLTFANRRLIFEERPYPYSDAHGNVVDEPVLHRLTYCDDPDSDRGVGLVRHLDDANRMYNWSLSRLMEYAKIGLVPQAVASPGLMRKQRLSAEPGKVYEIPNPDQNFKWRDNIQTPGELFQMLELAQQQIGVLAAQNAIPSQVEAGKAIQALIERDSTRRQQFLSNLAEWYSRVMRHCLMLTQKHYDEERLVAIKGSFGWETVSDFRGSDLRGQCDVRVNVASIEPRTREAIDQRIYVAMQNQWISPERGMHALETGSGDDLVKDIDIAVGRVHRVIQLIKQGEEALLNAQTQITTEVDPMTGLPMIDPETGMPREDPIWMPQEWDNLGIWKSELQAWFQTEEAEHLEPPMQQARNMVYQALLMQEARQQQKAAMQQQMMAEGLGMANAAAPQGAKPLPDQNAPPSGNPGGGITPNQPVGQGLPS
jgi:hypothetical protein